MENERNTNFWEKTYSQMGEREQTHVHEQSALISHFLLEQYNFATKQIIKALFLINSGGVITILAYWYRGAKGCSTLLLGSSLGMFLIGLILAFILVAADYFLCKHRVESFNSNMLQLYNNSITPSLIPDFNGHHPAPKYALTIVIIGIISGAAAGLGIFFGILGFFAT